MAVPFVHMVAFCGDLGFSSARGSEAIALITQVNGLPPEINHHEVPLRMHLEHASGPGGLARQTHADAR